MATALAQRKEAHKGGHVGEAWPNRESQRPEKARAKKAHEQVQVAEEKSKQHAS